MANTTHNMSVYMQIVTKRLLESGYLMLETSAARTPALRCCRVCQLVVQHHGCFLICTVQHIPPRHHLCLACSAREAVSLQGSQAAQ